MSNLEQALSTDAFEAHVEREDDRIEIHWTGDGWDGGGLLDLRHPDSVAEATAVIRMDGGVEWTRFMVQNGVGGPDARGHGIFSAALALTEELSREHGMWPQYIATNANNAPFYRAAGFADDPEREGLMVKEQDRADSWLLRD